MNLSKLFLSLIATGCVLPGLARTEEAAGQAATVQAQWQAREFYFTFMGIRAAYSCTSIEDQLEAMLRDLGARPDVQVSATGCVPGEISRTITTRIRVNMPVEAGSAATADSAAFPAQRKIITLTIHGDRRNHPMVAGDCELLEQVRRQLLPELKLQVMNDEVSCYPGEQELANKSMQVTALVPVEQAKGK